VSRKKAIDEFLEENKQSQMRDVLVTTMRHIVPQLLMETYSEHYQPYVRKGKQLLDRCDRSQGVMVTWLNV